MCPTAEIGCAEVLEPMVNKASMRTKHVDDSSFKSVSSFLKEESSSEMLVEEVAEAVDWFWSTGPTTLTEDGSTRTFCLVEDFFYLRSL